MAFLRYANARVVNTTNLNNGGWDNIRVASGRVRTDRNLVEQASKILGTEFDPSKYLLTHATIVASVDTIPVPGEKVGSAVVGGKKVVRKTASYRVKPECDAFINNNLDSFSRPVLLKAYPTFVGGHSFLEHVQIEELSKGRILDAVARDIGDSVYVDILVANDRKHSQLIRDIESGELSTLSMGCFLPGTQVSMADGTRVAIEDVQVGDQVLTHMGRTREVTNKQIRGGSWSVRRIEAVGVPSAITATEVHPFFVFRLPDVCACGCGESLPESYASGKRTSLPKRLSRRFRDGHRLRVLNPNGSYSLEEYASRRSRLDEIQSLKMEEVKAGDLKVGDFLCFPRSAFGTIVDTTPGRARLLGYFLAEGNFQKQNGKHHTVEFNFSLHEKETYAAEVARLLQEEFPGCNPRTYTGDESDGCFSTVVVRSEAVASWFLKHGGEYSHKKLLHPDVMAWSPDNQLHLLGAWINGDGTLQKGGVTSSVTVSYDLVCQMHAIMARCGIHARMYGRVHSKLVDVAEVVNGGLAQTLCEDGSYRRPSFQLDLGQTQSQVLSGYCDKVRSNPKFQTQAFRVLDDVVMFPITSIETQTYEGWVHDMEVEEDHSYVVEGVAVHNCTIDGSSCTKCGNWAADETEMCFPPGTRVLKSDGRYTSIEEIVAGDMVLTHKGNHRRVLNTMSRHYEGHVSLLSVDGIATPVRATVNHPFWVLRPRQECACGCGENLRRTVEHERGAANSFKRRFLPGHNSRVWNSNPDTKNNVLSFSDYSKVFDVDMEFVPAKDLQKGDYLTFPIPQEVKDTPDATVRKARLLGYFLAEGSYVKRDGERVGVSFTFGHHETDTLAREVVDLLNEEWGRDSRWTPSGNWQDRIAQSPINPIRRRVNSRPIPEGLVCPDCHAPSDYIFNGSKVRGQTYSCKICRLQWDLNADRSVHAKFYPSRVEGHGSCSVVLNLKEAADWFYHYCGEYSDTKQVHPDVMLWSPEIQKHIVFGWINGDGNQTVTGIVGSTASFHLMSQMHVLAARCGWYGRKQVAFAGKTTRLDQVVNGDGTVTMRDDRGWLPQMRLILSEPDGFEKEVRFTEREKARVTLSSFTDGFKRVGNWLLYRIRDTSIECYKGIVHNFEVEEDNSYVVEGLAVHNCNHILHEKGNTFYDESGVKHRIAELCGDVSIEPTGGVKFIEASWVKIPAFKGAVARNVVSINSSHSAKTAMLLEHILSSVPLDIVNNALRKVASDNHVASEDGSYAEEDGGENPFGEPAKVEEEEPKKEEAPKTKGMLDDAEADITDALVDKVKKRIKDQLQGPLPSSMAPNDTLVKQGSAYRTSLRMIVASSKTPDEVVRKIGSLNDVFGIKVPEIVYSAALRVGSLNQYGSFSQFLKACGRSLQRLPTKQEVKTIIRIGALISAHHSRIADGNKKETK